MKRAIALLIFVLPIIAFAQNKNEDWACIRRYENDNAKVVVRPKAVLYGDSITDVWPKRDPSFFTDNNFVGRGISGQTTSQILVRMQQDVVALSPKYVVILCGINDIALNKWHAVDIDAAIANIKSMCDIARAHKIRPVVCTLLPSYKIKWRPELGDVLDIVREFNSKLVAYATANHVKVADYYSIFAGDDGRISAKYSDDTVHPNLEGYRIMENCILEILK